MPESGVRIKVFGKIYQKGLSIVFIIVLYCMYITILYKSSLECFTEKLNKINSDINGYIHNYDSIKRKCVKLVKRKCL